MIMSGGGFSVFSVFFLRGLLFSADFADATAEVHDFFPKRGSLGGGVFLKIQGERFLDPQKVSMFSRQYVFLNNHECDIMLPMSTETEIICVTRPVEHTERCKITVQIISNYFSGSAAVATDALFEYRHDNTPVVKWMSHYGAAVGDLFYYGSYRSHPRRTDPNEGDLHHHKWQRLFAKTWAQVNTKLGDTMCLGDELLIDNHYAEHCDDDCVARWNWYVEDNYNCRLQNFDKPSYGRFQAYVGPMGLNDLRCNDLQCTCPHDSACTNGYGHAKYQSHARTRSACTNGYGHAKYQQRRSDFTFSSGRFSIGYESMSLDEVIDAGPMHSYNISGNTSFMELNGMGEMPEVDENGDEIFMEEDGHHHSLLSSLYRPTVSQKSPTGYDVVLYPEIYSVTPRYTGMNGGAVITIHGTGFGKLKDEIRILLGRSNNIPCDIISMNVTRIKCRIPRLTHTEEEVQRIREENREYGLTRPIAPQAARGRGGVGNGACPKVKINVGKMDDPTYKYDHMVTEGGYVGGGTVLKTCVPSESWSAPGVSNIAVSETRVSVLTTETYPISVYGQEYHDAHDIGRTWADVNSVVCCDHDGFECHTTPRKY